MSSGYVSCSSIRCSTGRSRQPGTPSIRGGSCPDLRGYGASAKPVERDRDVYSKPTMAADIFAVAEALRNDPFPMAGHDRGALVAIRAGLDHPGRISHLASLDVLPTLDLWEVLHGA
ncbi:alpha/beta fold hydrolase, partial [Nocardia cyriacigeorgica]|uniref:alpha/beta fold hydrolase n=1 Tax=Nocardia cyriacigeorgica TaxID=135487 RepID=UPI0024557644